MAEQNSRETLAVGDRIEQQHGPFLATWEVVEIIDSGARLRYCDDVRFVGHRAALVGGNGQDLTVDRMQSFLGRAHWPAAKRVVSTKRIALMPTTYSEERHRRSLPCVGGGMHAWRRHGDPATGSEFSACVACGVTETDEDLAASGRPIR